MTRRVLFLFPLVAAFGQSPALVSVQKIWDQGPHNAFTDLLRFRNEWFCAFRESDAHVGGNGGLRVLVSADGDHWKSVALLAEPGVDLRDPKLSITPEGRLMIVAGGSIYVGQAGGLSYQGRQPRVAFSRDGRRWTSPRKILASGDWLWRVTWHQRRAYGVSYVGMGTGTRSGALYTSRDGLHYTRVADLEVPGVAEVTLRFLPDHTMVALARREIEPRHGWIGTSHPPYTQWTWTEIPHRLGGPNFLVLPDGSLVAAGRAHTPSGPTTVVARMTTKSYEPVLTLPSGGDTSYPGMVFRDGLLWMSYYSSHEGKSSIYLAKIRLP